MDSKAIRPNFYQEFTSKVNEMQKEEIDLDTQAMAYITHYRGWVLLKEYEQKLEAYLDQLVSEALANGLSMAEVGERTTVKEMAKFMLRSLIKKAEDARRSEEK
jgi:hypothetical protein